MEGSGHGSRARLRAWAVALFGLSGWACGGAAAPAAVPVAIEHPTAESVAVSWAELRRSGFSGRPAQANERTIDVLFDEGSWVGWALPDEAHAGAWAGPYDLRTPGFRGALGLALQVDDQPPTMAEGWSQPGLLSQTLEYDAASVEAALYFVGPEHVVASYRLTRPPADASRGAAELTLTLSGEVFEPGGIEAGDHGVVLVAPGRSTPVRIDFGDGARVTTDARSYTATLVTAPVTPGGSTTVVVDLGSRLDGRRPHAEDRRRSSNRARWAARLRRAWSAGASPMSASDRALAASAVQTLVANWRQPSEKIDHEGLFPAWAYDGFHGFWAWDSWKHAVVLARFDPRLAKEQVRVMLLARNEEGMVPDVIYPGPEADNWRDTKPPLATWAVAEIYGVDPDLEFVQQMLPHLLAYHRWWYRNRDHDQNGLCEYGSTDGTRIAAAWESGMDNAVRFDGAQMQKNGPSAWSMDRESVDLNAYLVVDKRMLAELLRATGQRPLAERLEAEADALAERIRERFWDPQMGWFRDRTLDGAFAEGRGPEGWIPLWAGVATPSQAQRVRDAMIDPAKFGTHVPLGTLAADEPGFDPQRGYWRGPVWLDQAYFGLAGLRRYGYDAEADDLQGRLLANAEGLRDGAAIRENYHPLTGAGQNARHFSWSTAAILMMLWELPAP